MNGPAVIGSLGGFDNSVIGNKLVTPDRRAVALLQDAIQFRSSVCELHNTEPEQALNLLEQVISHINAILTGSKPPPS